MKLILRCIDSIKKSKVLKTEFKFEFKTKKKIFFNLYCFLPLNYKEIDYDYFDIKQNF